MTIYTRREFFREILYNNIAIIAIQHNKINFVGTFSDFSHTVEWNSLKFVWQDSWIGSYAWLSARLFPQLVFLRGYDHTCMHIGYMHMHVYKYMHIQISMHMHSLINKLYQNATKIKRNHNIAGFKRRLLRTLHKILVHNVISKFRMKFRTIVCNRGSNRNQNAWEV